MTETIHIRRAVPADSDALVTFNAAMALETEGKTLAPGTLQAGVEGVLREPARGFYLVAEVASNVIAGLMITYEWSDWRNGNWWWLQSVYVRESHRRGGVFRAMYAHIERNARATAGVVGLRLYVERENIHAQRTYTALGMHETPYRLWEQGFTPDTADSQRR